MYGNREVTMEMNLDDILKAEGFKIVEYECKTEDNAYVALWRIQPDLKTEENEEE